MRHRPFGGHARGGVHPPPRVVFTLLIVTLLLAGTELLSQEAGPDGAVVARIGDVLIGEREFVERFELAPGLGRERAHLDEARVEFLYSLVAEKLLAQEARDRGLDRTPAFLSSQRVIRKMLARDQLYREQVSGSVTIEAAEVEEERRRASSLSHVEFLYFPREENARFVASNLGNPPDLASLTVDSSMEAERDTATVIWGDADPAIEEAVSSLRIGEVSPPVRAGTGWYLLKLRAQSPSGILSGLRPEEVTERLTDRVRRRKEDVRMHEVLREILSAGRAEARRGPFRALAGALADVLLRESAEKHDSLLTLTRSTADSVRHRCAEILSETLAVAGSESWSLEEVLERLLSRRFQIPRDRIAGLAGALDGELEYLTQQELVAQEALRRGLAERPEVKRRADLWSDAMLADVMKDSVRRAVRVSPQDREAFMKLTGKSSPHLRVNLRVLQTHSLVEMEGALAELAAGADFGDVVSRWSSDENLRAQRGETGFFPVGDRPLLGELASGMQPGERLGPVWTPEGPVTFELLARRDTAGEVSALSAEPDDTSATRLLALKQQGVLNMFLAGAARRRNVDVYTDRVRLIDVSPIPMLTYRILGFGGRMFEVPFVDPQIQWLRVDPPDTSVVP